MKLLLDQGLPRSTIAHLQATNLHAEHVADLGLAAADDATILEEARNRLAIVVTLDADFHAILATQGKSSPSVIRLRVEGMKGDQLATLLIRALQVCGDDLAKGALISVTETSIRMRLLPVA